MLYRTWLMFGCSLLTLSAGCDGPRFVGSGVAASQQRTLEPFSAIELYGIGALEVQPGDALTVTVQADDNMLEHIKTTVEGQTLRMGVGSGSYVWTTGPRFELASSAASSYVTRGQTSLLLQDVDKDVLSITAEGQCSIRVTGRVGKLSIQLNGQCAIDLDGAKIDTIDGQLNGQCSLSYSGDTKVNVEKSFTSAVNHVDTP